MNGGFLFILVLLLLFLWLVFVRPQRRRQQDQLELWHGLQEGDEVVTAGGIYGEITGFVDDDVLLRIAPELEVRVARRAIGAVTRAPTDDHAESGEDSEAAEDSTAEAESYSEESR